MPARNGAHHSLCAGASSGIGAACAWRLAEAGCKLVLLARRADRLEALRTDIQSRFPGTPIHLVAPFDVREYRKVADLPAVLPPDFAEVDILLNNAGLALGVAGVADNDVEDAAAMMETNVMAVVAFTKAFVAGMVARDRGHVVNISSIAGHEAYSGGSLYCASKHALDAFTTSARHDLVGSQVRVTAISPGAVKTEFSVVRFKGDVGKADAVYDGYEHLTAEDVADNVLYALTRPAHVQVADMVVLCTNQSSAKNVARVQLNSKPKGLS